jgi:hypothetical protein
VSGRFVAITRPKPRCTWRSRSLFALRDRRQLARQPCSTGSARGGITLALYLLFLLASARVRAWLPNTYYAKMAKHGLHHVHATRHRRHPAGGRSALFANH